jgi:hypothetical protein
VGDHALDTQGGEHDAGDDREVPIGVGLHGQLGPGLAVRLQQSVLGRQRHHVEVQPPQADRGGHPEDGREQQRRADGLGGGAHADRDDRLAEGQDDEQAVSFAPVPGAVDPPVAVPGGEIDGDPVDQEGTGEQQRLGPPADQHPQHQEGSAGQRGQPGDRDLPAQPTVTAGGHGVDREVQEADQQERAHQDQRPIQAAGGVLPGFGDGEGDHEHGRHGHGHGRPEQPLVGPRLVAEPGVGRPGPPQQGEQQQPLEHAVGAVRVPRVAGDLRQGKDVDQVEE